MHAEWTSKDRHFVLSLYTDMVGFGEELEFYTGVLTLQALRTFYIYGASALGRQFAFAFARVRVLVAVGIAGSEAQSGNDVGIATLNSAMGVP